MVVDPVAEKQTFSSAEGDEILTGWWKFLSMNYSGNVQNGLIWISRLLFRHPP